MASADDQTSMRRQDSTSSPGEVILKKLFAQFVVTAELKLNHLASQPVANPLSKYLQRGDDPNLDQLLSSLKEVSRFSLKSILTALVEWRKRQMKQIQSRTQWNVVANDANDSPQNMSKKELEYYIERQQLAVDFLFCMTLIEVLQQLPIHPVPESFIHQIEELAFSHFKAQEPLKERSINNPNVANAKRVADLYAEVIGVLSQVRFLSVRMRFFAELRNVQNSLSVIISIIEGLSFVRVKMYPVEELEGWFHFLQECAGYMLESTKGEKVRHAMSHLLVEILTPVAAVIKYEVSMPAVKKLVQMLYTHCYDQAKKQRHATAYTPLVTVLLAISEDAFFLNNWHIFVSSIIMPSLKKNDTKLQCVALDSLYRLLWVYMIRIKGEGNVKTFNRLKPIVEYLFPRHSARGIQYKDFPTNMFVKIIHFIAREKVDYALPEIVLDLITKHRGGTLNPERVIIGLRAYLMVADSLEKKEGDPSMPLAYSQTGSITRSKTKFLTSTLTEQIAKKIGLVAYHMQICQALTGILRQLDSSVGRPLVSTSSQATRAPEEALGGEKKPKLDLLKTCVAAIPRLIPEGLTKEELIEFLSRLTIHIDTDLARMSITALQNLFTNYPSWRPDIIQGFAIFVMRDIPDSCPLVLDGAQKVLGQLLNHWKSLIPTSIQVEELPHRAVATVEACALVTFCSYRSVTRKLSLAILKEVKACYEALVANRAGQEEDASAGNGGRRVLDVMEKATPDIIKFYLGTLSLKERGELRTHNLSLAWLADRSACFLEHGGGRESLKDAWTQCIVGLLEPHVLPVLCPLAVQLTWPYILQRMMKAYSVIDSSFIVPDRWDRPPQLRIPRGGYVSQPEMFLWRNYMFFACCTAPPSSSPYPVPPTPGLYEAGLLLGDKHPRQFTAKDLVQMIASLIRSEGEIGEVAITTLGLSNPAAFSDLIEVLRPLIQDALDLRRSDNVKRRKRRETERIHITKIISLAAGHGCFRLCPNAITKQGEVMKEILDYIDGIRLCFLNDADKLQILPTDLRLHYSALISNIITSISDGPSRMKLFPLKLRKTLFFMVGGWSGGFWEQTDGKIPEDSLIKQSRSNILIFNVLQCMSALVCCGPIFDQDLLVKEKYFYRWLDNMLCSSEEKIQELGQFTVQQLLEYNRQPLLLQWVLDRCYNTKSTCALLCFKALATTFAKNPSYPCKMISILLVILYYTASLDQRTRERALQLLHILDRRFLASDTRGTRRPELLGRITGSSFSNVHVAVSEELAFTNPELSLPLFSEIVQRFEEAPSLGRQSLLQLMRPWLRNVELVEESSRFLSSTHSHELSFSLSKSTNPVLSGSGWGSIEGTHLVLHNLLYLTTKYGDEYTSDIEYLWSALCTWPFNMRVALNYLARLSCIAGNCNVMLQQAKRILIYFSRTHPKSIILELIKELQSVELVTMEIQPIDVPPFYRFAYRGTEYSNGRKDSHISRSNKVDAEGDTWAVEWRNEVRDKEGQPTPLPVPGISKFFASMKEALRLPCRQGMTFHRNSFALILLSEIIGDTLQFDWLNYLPLLLHVVTLGLDVHRPVVCQHSKKLLCNLTIMLACSDDYHAASQARLMQHEVLLCSPSLLSLSSTGDVGGGELQRCGSLNSLENREIGEQTVLAKKAVDLIKYLSVREYRRSPWPFIDHTSSKELAQCDVYELNTLVEKIVSVFQPCYNGTLVDKWSKTALQWATSCSSQQFASQSFQLCRALHVPLSPSMLRDILPRLAELASDSSDEVQNYVLETLLSLESALDHTQENILHPPTYFLDHQRQTSDITPLHGDQLSESLNFNRKMESSLTTPTLSLSIGRLPNSSKMSTPTNPALAVAPPPPPVIEEVTPSETPPFKDETPPSKAKMVRHRRNHSRGHSITKVELLPSDLIEQSNTSNTNVTSSSTEANDTLVKDDSLPAEPLHSPPAAGATSTRPQSAIGRIKASTSFDIELETQVNGSDIQTRDVSSAKDSSNSRKSSVPPIHLMNLFEPLPNSAHKVVATENTHQQPRPQSELITTTMFAKSPLTSSYSCIPSIVTIAKTAAIDTTPPTLPAVATETATISTATKITTTEPSPLTTPTVTPISKHSPHPSTLGDISPCHHQVEFLQVYQEEDSPPSKKRLPLLVDTSNEPAANISKAPSHPDLRVKPSYSKDTALFEGIMRARSVSQLQSELNEEVEHYKRRSYSGSRDTVPGYSGLTKDSTHFRGSLDKLREKGAPSPSSSPVMSMLTRLPLSHQNSPIKDALRRRISADPEKERIHSAPGSRNRSRPRSMFETGTSWYNPHHGNIDSGVVAATDVLSQLFWTSLALMLSDYEMEFSLALRLFDKVTCHLDFNSDITYDRLNTIFVSAKWSNFPGVLKVLLKGLTLVSTTQTTRKLVSKLCSHVHRQLFDPTSSCGLPLSVIALLPELVLHFESPTADSMNIASDIAKACSILVSSAMSIEQGQVIKDIGHLFTVYGTKDFNNNRSVWLKSVCHYICKGYMVVTEDILRLLGNLLEEGCDKFHQSVLLIVYEFLIKLEENGNIDMNTITQIITPPVSQFIKGSLWQEALDVLSLVVKTSSSLVQPTTPHIPMVDLGFFHESLPGPTLQFSVDLASDSQDLRLAQEVNLQSSWRRPHGCQKITRDKLLGINNACGTVHGLFTSPSVIFTDEQMPPLIYTESEDEFENYEEEQEMEMIKEEGNSLRESTEVLDSSQQESVYINTIGDTFNFLNQYSDEEESEGEERAIEGPFSSRGDQRYSSSPSSSQSSFYDEEEDIRDYTHHMRQPSQGSQRSEKHSRSTSPVLSQDYKSSPSHVQCLEESLEGTSSVTDSLPIKLDTYADVLTTSDEYSSFGEGTPVKQHSIEKDFVIISIEEDDMGGDETTPIPVVEVKDVRSSETTPTDTAPPEIETTPCEMISSVTESTPLKRNEADQTNVTISDSDTTPTTDGSTNEEITLILGGATPTTATPIAAASFDFVNEKVLANDEQEMEEPITDDKELSLHTSSISSNDSMMNALPLATVISAVEEMDNDDNNEVYDMTDHVIPPDDREIINEHQMDVVITDGTRDELPLVLDDEDKDNNGDGDHGDSDGDHGDGDGDSDHGDGDHGDNDDADDEDDDDVLNAIDDDIQVAPRVGLHRASHFICISDEEIMEVWSEHVDTLGRSKNLSIAVNTFYLFQRLFKVVCQQICTMTQEATNYIAGTLYNISTHFLVTTELITSQLKLPAVYVDIELISRTSLLGPLIFFAMEIQNNLIHFESQKSSVLENLSQCKLSVIESYSSPPSSPISIYSPHQKSLTLCHSIHQIHFQLLLLVSSYIKLLNLLTNAISNSQDLMDISQQLNTIHHHILSTLDSNQSTGLMSAGVDRDTEVLIQEMKSEQAMRYLQDTVAKQQSQLAVQILHYMRSHFQDDQLFGNDSSDDIDILFFAYAHCIAEGKDGVVGITSLEHNLLETHSHLMTQNVSLLTLLEKQQLPDL